MSVATGTDFRDAARTACIAVCAGDWARLETVMRPDAVLQITEDAYLSGIATMAPYFEHYLEYYRLTLPRLDVICDDTEAAVEATLRLEYVKDKPGLPASSGQVTEIPIGVFFTFAGTRIGKGRVFYSLDDWMELFADPVAGRTAGEEAP